MAQSISRQRSKTSVKDQEIVQIATWFRQWGFMDYIAARILLMRPLETIDEKIPTRVQNVDKLQEALARVQHAEMAKDLEVGDLLLPACVLAATSLEKYFKAVVTLKEKKKPRFRHLNAKLVRSVENAVKGIFKVINKDFIEYLRKCYELRYFDKMDQQSTLVISPRMTLSALDFTVAEMEKTISVTFNGFEIPYSYQSACQLKMPSLWQHNYVLLGMDKTSFLKQRDFRFTIISHPSVGLRMSWIPTDSTDIDNQFFVNAFRSAAGKVRAIGVNSPTVSLDLQATIKHYFPKNNR